MPDFSHITRCTTCNGKVRLLDAHTKCGVCGKVFCYKCGQALPLTQLAGANTARVCDECLNNNPHLKVIDPNHPRFLN